MAEVQSSLPAAAAGMGIAPVSVVGLVFEVGHAPGHLRQQGLDPSRLPIHQPGRRGEDHRIGRKWLSAPGSGLWFSILLRSRISPNQLPMLVQIAAIACADAVEKWAMQPVRIKPPNDLILGGGKLAGFLLETSNRWDFQVLGIGINVRSAPEIAGYPTSSVEQFSLSRVSRSELAVDLLTRFEERYLGMSLAEVPFAFESRVLKPVSP